MEEIDSGDIRTAQWIKQFVPHSVLQLPHFLLCDNALLIVLPDAVKSGNLGLDFWHILRQFFLDLITAILLASEMRILRAAPSQ